MQTGYLKAPFRTYRYYPTTVPTLACPSCISTTTAIRLSGTPTGLEDKRNILRLAVGVRMEGEYLDDNVRDARGGVRDNE